MQALCLPQTCIKLPRVQESIDFAKHYTKGPEREWSVEEKEEEEEEKEEEGEEDMGGTLWTWSGPCKTGVERAALEWVDRRVMEQAHTITLGLSKSRWEDFYVLNLHVYIWVQECRCLWSYFVDVKPHSLGDVLVHFVWIELLAASTLPHIPGKLTWKLLVSCPHLSEQCWDHRLMAIAAPCLGIPGIRIQVLSNLYALRHFPWLWIMILMPALAI